MISVDLYDNGTTKHSVPADIYDDLNEMSSGEEIGILADMFGDVSWEGQDYYYTDSAGALVERWDHLTDGGDKMWIMDVAAWQLERGDANDWMYQILCNDELSKRIGFKKIFADIVLGGVKSRYEAVSERFLEELQEADRFDFYGNSMALQTALRENGYTVYKNPYSELCSAVWSKLRGLKLDEERKLIVESRAILTAYDDFMFGLRANQALYQEQEKRFESKVALLQQRYEAEVQRLLSLAQEQGISLALPTEKPFLEEKLQGGSQ